MTFQQQSERYLKEISNRRRDPVQPGTVQIYQSYLESRILPELGKYDLLLVDNGVAKSFISKLNSTDLAPATINGIFKVVKSVVSSAVDRNGNELYPRKWNHAFIDLPIVRQADQDTPIVTSVQIMEAVLKAKRQDQAMITLLAASGVRIGELLALKGHSDDGLNSVWDRENAVLHIRTTLKKGKVQFSTKTDSGVRQVDLHPDVNNYLLSLNLPIDGFLFRSNQGGSVRYNTFLKRLQNAGINAGCHSFRRFRVTYLESQNVPRGLAMYWTGHAGSDVHESYIKIGQDLQARKYWAGKAGYGFEINGGK